MRVVHRCIEALAEAALVVKAQVASTVRVAAAIAAVVVVVAAAVVAAATSAETAAVAKRLGVGLLATAMAPACPKFRAKNGQGQYCFSVFVCFSCFLQKFGTDRGMDCSHQAPCSQSEARIKIYSTAAISAEYPL
jgi:hypothetical protein